MKLLHSAKLPIELTNGNDGRGSKWFSSSKLRNQYERLLRLQGHQRTPFDVPVMVRVTRILGKRQQLWDFDSGLRGNAKEIFDSLVVLGWFTDDGPKFITEVQFRQDVPKDRVSPFTLVEVFDPMAKELTEETKKLLLAFGDNWEHPLSVACKDAFTLVQQFWIPALVKDAVRDGLLLSLDGEVKDTNGVYGMNFRLTDDGRKQVGMNPWPVPKPVVVKKEEKTLF